ncbi:ABC transporter ATP-binding protein [Halobacillus locisalis]|uniref:ABC transporter ATP-binding protein n=1 Tax=Halobacillus locisalis TaxID=220753 RepID=A0A838CWL7_9BACI|nr:ABC transporter ATP-binding protein [Halobacillus locisalis]MBA2176324.1 ABC transporter ATP-binding protein [Halobacillus locisalis]
MKAIHCKELTKQYRRKAALDGVDLSIDDNKIIGLIGRNGAGKTTLLKIISGMLRESSGHVEVFSKRPFNNLFVSANSIYIDDQMNFPPSLTLKELLKEGRRFYKNWDHDLALRLFEHFGFHEKESHKNLSKGKESTFNMIVGLCSRCPLTIFDEPTTGMDAAVRKDFHRALLKDYIAHPRTILLSTHYMNEMEDLFEEVVLLDHGKLRLHTTMDDLREYAIGLSGKVSSVQPWLEGRDVLDQQESGLDDVQVAVKHDYTDGEIQRMRLDGISVTSIQPTDACMFLTKQEGGGLDHVFRSNESE